MDHVVHADEDPDIARLLSHFAHIKRRADDVNAELETVKAAIKNKLTAITDPNTPGGPAPYNAYTVNSPYTDAPGVTLRWVTSRRVNTSSLKKVYPHIADEFTEIKGAWRLEGLK